MLVKDLKRDDVSGALISTDTSALEQYKLARARMKELNNLKEEVGTIKGELSEIKQMLKAVLNDC